MRPRSILDWIALALVIALCAAAAFAAYTLANQAWNGLVDYKSPYVGLDLPKASSGSQIATTTVVVIVDGLSDTVSRKLDGLQRLRQYGTDMTLLAPQPSLSFPDWTTLLSGAPPYVSGVTTNWFEGRVKVETLLDSALASGVRSVVVGPAEMAELYGAERATASFLRSYPTTFYASIELVDQAVRLVGQVKPRLAILHLPDVDNAGHEFGAGSTQYLETARRVDSDIARLVQALQGEGVAFVITADHGHIGSGGHGGGESSVVRVPGIFFGQGIALSEGDADQEDVAPTVAVLAGIPVPRFSKGDVIDAVVPSAGTARLQPAWAERLAFADAYARLVLSPTGQSPKSLTQDEHGAKVTRLMADADSTRLSFDRRERIWFSLAGFGACLVILAAVGLVSWRALAAAGAGVLVYYIVYDGLYFIVHGYRWSLSSFNEESMVRAFFNARMLEAATALFVAAAVAAVIYPFFRSHGQGPSGSYLPRWLTLGPVTALAVLATLGMQVAWFAWAWGLSWTWRLPDLMWGFKYDLDLIQATAIGAAAVLTSLVTYLIGRYHPRTRVPAAPVPARVDIPADRKH